MRRGYLIFAAMLLPLLVGMLLVVRLLSVGDCDRALGRLGRGGDAYRLARTTLVLGTGDAAEAVIRYAGAPGRTSAQRTDALRILHELATMRRTNASTAPLTGMLVGASSGMQVRVLEVLGLMRRTEAAPAVEALFHTAADSAVRNASYHALRQMAATVLEELETAIREDSAARVDSCMALTAHLIGGKAPIYRAAAGYLQGKGDSTRAASLLARIGFVDTCWVSGPFANDRVDGYNLKYGPETRPFDARDTFAIDAQTTARWLKVSTVTHEGAVDYNRLFSKECCSVSYLLTYLHAPGERDALLLLNYFEPVRVWLNDSLVWSHRVYRATESDADAVAVHLRAGVNTLLIKSVQDLATWRITARLTDQSGDAMPDVRWSWSRELPATVAR